MISFCPKDNGNAKSSTNQLYFPGPVIPLTAHKPVPCTRVSFIDMKENGKGNVVSFLCRRRFCHFEVTAYDVQLAGACAEGRPCAYSLSWLGLGVGCGWFSRIVAPPWHPQICNRHAHASPKKPVLSSIV